MLSGTPRLAGAVLQSVAGDGATGGLAAVAVLVAALLEAAVGEPPRRLHPVAWLGRLVAPFDREWPFARAVGLAVAVGVPFAAAGAVATAVWLSASAHPWLGVAVAGLALFVATSLRMLLAEARTVVAASAADLPVARDRLRSLAGRDAADLSPALVRSAAVESAAENLADGLVAPLGAFVGAGIVAAPFGAPWALALAAGAAAWVKAVNTLDSMLGYPSKSVGWAPARLDDLVMWLPARASALLIGLASARPGAVSSARAWLDEVPSPNAGWPMGVVAAAADARLAKPGVYVLNADADLPSVGTARAAVRTVGVAGVLAYALAVGTLALGEVLAWS